MSLNGWHGGELALCLIAIGAFIFAVMLVRALVLHKIDQEMLGDAWMGIAGSIVGAALALYMAGFGGRINAHDAKVSSPIVKDLMAQGYAVIAVIADEPPRAILSSTNDCMFSYEVQLNQGHYQPQLDTASNADRSSGCSEITRPTPQIRRR